MTSPHLTIEAKRAIRGAPKRHAEAYRARARDIGLLASCICTFPLDVDPTTLSGCDPRCPREQMARSYAELDKRKVER